MTSTMTITLVTAGAAALLNLWLALRTGAVRMKARVDIGDGGNEALIRRMRAHANFVEYAPFVVILIGVIELTTGTSLWLWGASVLFIMARIAHAIGMDGIRAARAGGFVVTFALLLGLGGYAVLLPFLTAPATSTQAPSAVPRG